MHSTRPSAWVTHIPGCVFGHGRDRSGEKRSGAVIEAKAKRYRTEEEEGPIYTDAQVMPAFGVLAFSWHRPSIMPRSKARPPTAAVCLRVPVPELNLRGQALGATSAHGQGLALAPPATHWG